MTSFISAEVRLFDGLALHIDGNSKISWGNGTYAAPKPNALSLPHIATCPGSTERCRSSCYVHGLKKAAPEVYRTYELNEMAIHAVLQHHTTMVESAVLLASWIRENAAGGFRWHVSGDVMGWQHAVWIVTVCRAAPEVPFWIYTRTLDAVQELVKAKNLAVNVSADVRNYERAAGVAAKTGARLCYLVSEPGEQLPELRPGDVIFPDYPLRGRSLPIATDHAWWKALDQERRRQVCPADFFGQSESSRCGPCDKCLYPRKVAA
jgi:hypothetical protein